MQAEARRSSQRAKSLGEVDEGQTNHRRRTFPPSFAHQGKELEISTISVLAVLLNMSSFLSTLYIVVVPLQPSSLQPTSTNSVN